MPGPTPEKLASPGDEQSHQTALFCWAALESHHWPELELLHAIPNGGGRNKIEAGFLKASGVRSGVPDISLPVARHGLHGLYIELKREPNTPSDNQRAWIKRLNAGGYAALVAYSWVEAKDYITAYLEPDDDQASVSCSGGAFRSAANKIRDHFSRL